MVALEKGGLGKTKRGEKKGVVLVVEEEEVEGESGRNEDEEDEIVEIEVNTIFVDGNKRAETEREEESVWITRKTRIWFCSHRILLTLLLCSVIAVTTYTHH